MATLSPLPLETTSERRLADLLEQDIRSRKLVFGDRYLTAREAGHLLGVSKTTADRAMNLLSQSGILRRKRNRGSYVGSAIGMKSNFPLRTICGLMPEFYKTIFDSGLLMQGLCNHTGHVSQLFNHLPTHGIVEHVKGVIKFATSGGAVAGVVAISCPREVYSFLADCGLPVVVLGSLYSCDPILPSVETDHRQAGRLLTQLLIDQGHRRIVLMNPTEIKAGENSFFDGISEVLTNADLPHNALIVRAVPHEGEAKPFCSAVRELIEMPDRPTAFIARYQGDADLIASVASEFGLATSEDFQIVFRGQAEESAEKSDYPHTQPVMRLEQIGEQIGDMLGRLADGLPLEKQRVVIPVRLCGGRTGAAAATWRQHIGPTDKQIP